MDKVIVKDSKIQGKGVYANQDLSADDIVLKINDSNIVSDLSSLTEKQNKYECDYLAGGKVVLMQSPEKYINHSCDPSTYTKTVNGVRNVVTMRVIKKGEEITFDYSINGYNNGTFKCSCRSKNCRGIYQGNFFKLQKNVQLKYLPYLEGWFIEEHRQEIKNLRKFIKK